MKTRIQGLTEMKIVHGKSMDEIDKESFGAGPAPMDSRATAVVLKSGTAVHPAGARVLTLDGTWEMAEGGDEQARLADGAWADAIPAQVPGSVHAALVAAGKLPDPTMGRNQLMAAEASYKTWWFKTSFPKTAGTNGERLVFDGVCNHCTVWLNGRRLGGHEGMFGGPEFSLAEPLRNTNTLIVRLDAIPRDTGGWHGSNDSWKKTTVFNNVYGWHYSQCPSLGIWRSVRVESAPAVRIKDPFIATRDPAKGIVDLAVALEGAGGPWSGKLRGTIAPENFTGPTRTFAVATKSSGGAKTLHLRFRIPNPQLWWPVDMGAPNLYRMTLSFVPAAGPSSVRSGAAGAADTRSFTFGIRTVEMAPLPGGPRPDKFNWTFVINGKPMFVKGTGWCTLDPLMDFSRPRYERFLTLARDQHCQMIRAWGSGMPETDDFYDLCDRLGIMVMQEWPTAWNSHETQPYDMLEETVRLNTLRIRNRPSLVIYTGGNESHKPFGKAIDMMGRYAIELDGTRPFHRGEPWGGSAHNYDSYWGRQPLDRHVTHEADFYGEFGLACMPMYESVQRYLPANEKTLWPPPPDGAFAYHTPIFNKADCLSRLTQFSRYFAAKDADMERFTVASQVAQVVCLRHQLERARVRWPACTGALYYKMNDNFSAASWATADWYGAPKIGHYFVQDAFAPLHACVLFPSVNNVGAHLDLPVYLLDDANALEGSTSRVVARAYDGNLREIKRAVFENVEKSTAWLGHGWKVSRLFKEQDVTTISCRDLSRAAGWDAVPDAGRKADDLVDIHDMRGTRGIVFLSRHIRLTQAANMVLRIGHDGGARVFVDGRPVAANAGTVNPVPVVRTEVPLRLAAGKHEIVVALDRADGRGWGIFASLTAATGQPPPRWERLLSENVRAQPRPRKCGVLPLSFEETDTVPLLVVAEVLKDGVLADRTFYWVNYEPVKGCLFNLPRTTLTMKVEGDRAIVTNTGTLPAVAVCVARPGHLDTFTADDNYFWLDAGESKTVRVSHADGLTVEAWNSRA